MDTVNVRTKGLDRSSAEILNSMKRISAISDEVNGVANHLVYKAAGSDEIIVKLHKIAAALETNSQTGVRIGSNLEQIAAFYRNAEKSIMNDVSAVNKSIADTASAIAESAAGIGVFAGFQKIINNFLVGLYESQHPEEAKLVNDFLNGGTNNKLTDAEKNEIKLKIYNAKEPYKTIYLRNLDKFAMGDGDVGGDENDPDKSGAYYMPGDRTVNYNYSDDNLDSFNDDPRDPYTVFFHECGHGIDDVADLTNVDGSDTSNFTYHSDAMGRDVTLIDAIKYDVYDNPDNPHSVRSMAADIMQYNKGVSGANVDNVINALKNGTDPSNLSFEDARLYNNIQNQFNHGLDSNRAHCESVTDVYGGVTHDVLCNGYQHSNEYWDGRDAAAPARELWAEYFSYNMSDSSANLNALKEYFPEASKVLDSYANSLAA